MSVLWFWAAGLFAVFGVPTIIERFYDKLEESKREEREDIRQLSFVVLRDLTGDDDLSFRERAAAQAALLKLMRKIDERNQQ